MTSFDITILKNELRKKPNYPWDYTPNFAKETIYVDFQFESFDHHETNHTPKKTSLVCNCSKTPNSNTNSPLVVNHDSFTIPTIPNDIRPWAKPKPLVQPPPSYLVFLNLTICTNCSSSNYSEHHLNHSDFSSPSLCSFCTRFFFFCHSHKIKLNDVLHLSILEFLFLIPRSIFLLMWTTFFATSLLYSTLTLLPTEKI